MNTINEDQFRSLIDHINEREKWHEENDPFVKDGILPSRRFPRKSLTSKRHHIKTGFFSSTTRSDENGLSRTWLYPNFAFMYRLMDTQDKKSWGIKRTTIEFNQRRSGYLIKQFTSLNDIQKFQQSLENIFIVHLVKKGFDGYVLRRNEGDNLVLSKDENADSKTLLKAVFKKTIRDESYSRYEEGDRVDFGTLTRSLIPDFLNTLNIHYFLDSFSATHTSFSVPMLDIEKINFYRHETSDGVFAQHITENFLKADDCITFSYLVEKILSYVGDATAEVEGIDRFVSDKFVRNIQDIRAIRNGLPVFKSCNPSSQHMDIIPMI